MPSPELVDGVEQARIGEAIARLLRADALIAIGRALAVVGAVDRVARVVRPVRAHEHAAALGEARDPERAEERVEQARVVRVLHVLDVELPVVRQHLHEAAEHLDGLAHHAHGGARGSPGRDSRRARAPRRTGSRRRGRRAWWCGASAARARPCRRTRACRPGRGCPSRTRCRGGCPAGRSSTRDRRTGSAWRCPRRRARSAPRGARTGSRRRGSRRARRGPR